MIKNFLSSPPVHYNEPFLLLPPSPVISLNIFSILLANILLNYNKMMPSSDQMETLTLTASDDPLSSYTVHFPPASPSNGSDPLLNPPPSSSSSYIDPPSYADVVFTPFNNSFKSNGNTANDKETTTSNNHDQSDNRVNLTSEYVKITVTDPQKEHAQGSSYISYKITTKTIDQGHFLVRRRFSDFVTLADRLSETYRGYFIPIRPDKSVVESQVMQKHDFVEQRRSALEKYLLKLVSHPVIGKSEEMKMFLNEEVWSLGLGMEGKVADVASKVMEFVGTKEKEEVSVGGGGKGVMRLFRELKQSVSNEWVGLRPMVVEEDGEFLEWKERVKDLEVQLSSASKQAEALVKAQHDMGETMGELGLAFLKLGKFETEEAVFDSQRTRAADIKRVGTAAVRTSRSYREFNSQTVKHLDTLHEYLGMMLAVHGAFSDRSSALLTVQTLMSDLSSLHTRAEKLEAASSKIFGGDKTRTTKLEELKETIRNTEDAKIRATKEYERIKENNRNELERLDRDRRVDFLGMLKGFVYNQVGYAEKHASIWAQVVEETSRYAKQSN